jgi:hypothetical protein
MNDATHARDRKKDGPKRRRLRFVLRIVLAFVLLFMIFVGPWPAMHGGYVGSSYHTATLARLDAFDIALPEPTPLRIGVAEVDITPEVGHKLAGYSAQPVKECRAIFEPVFVRALSLEASGTLVTILTADLLLVHPRVAEAVLAHTGLSHDDVYFTSSHTHTGPGEWDQAWFGELAVGSYNDAYFHELVNQLASAITASRETLVAVEIGVAVAHAPDRLRSRIDGMDDTDDRIMAIIFRDPESQSAVALLTCFAAHATASGREDLRIGADYPGGITARLRELTGAPHVLFAAGTVGDAAPLPGPGGASCELAHAMGAALADALAPALANATFQSDVELSSMRLSVDLPRVRLPLGRYFETSPVLAKWIGDAQAPIHVLRIGPVILAGMPCDYSGGAAQPLIEWASEQNMVAIATSFNGDYEGYFVSPAQFDLDVKMEQRAMFLRGKWAGDFFADLAIRIASRMVEQRRTEREAR